MSRETLWNRRIEMSQPNQGGSWSMMPYESQLDKVSFRRPTGKRCWSQTNGPVSMRMPDVESSRFPYYSPKLHAPDSFQKAPSSAYAHRPPQPGPNQHPPDSFQKAPSSAYAHRPPQPRPNQVTPRLSLAARSTLTYAEHYAKAPAKPDKYFKSRPGPSLERQIWKERESWETEAVTDVTKVENRTTQLTDAGDCNELPEFDVNEEKSPFYMEFVRVYNEIQLTKEDEVMRKRVQSDIHLIFQSVVPHLKVSTFGSVYTGLANRWSDMDVTLESSTDLGTEFIKKYGYLVRRSPKFKNVVVIAHARVPIIKATHTATSVEVDINGSSRHSLSTTAIIKFLMSGNERAKRLTMLINHWAKLQQLIAPNKLSSYVVNLLTVFYLQQQDPPIFPPVSELLQCEDWGNRHPYCVRMDSRLLKTRNVTESRTLFGGFFKYYADFDFENNVISCYQGKPIPVSDLETPKLKNDTDKFPVGKMNIQDLIDLNMNKTNNILPRVFTSFKMSLTRVKKSLTLLHDTEWLRTILSQPPIEIAKETKVIAKSFEMTYPVVDEDWFVTLQRDVEYTLNLLRVQTSSTVVDTTSFTVKVNCLHSVFGKKFKRVVPSLLAGELTVETFSAKVKEIMDRISKPATRLEAELTVAVIDEGRLLVTLKDLCEEFSSSIFSSYMMCLQAHFEKLLCVCHKKWQS